MYIKIYSFIALLLLCSCSNEKEKLEEKIHNLGIENKKLTEELNETKAKINQPSEIEKESSILKNENDSLKNVLKTFELRFNIKKIKDTYSVEEAKDLFKRLEPKELTELLGKPDSRNIEMDEIGEPDEQWIYKNIIIDELTGERKNLIINLNPNALQSDFEIK
jgi:seryl-tRNA synthetase